MKISKKSADKTGPGRGGPRANSGGARPGAGRKPARLSAELLERIGAPPSDPLDQQEWYARAVTRVQWEVMQGQPYGPVLDSLQKSAKLAAALLPEAIKAKAARLLKRNEDERERDASAAPNDEPAPRREDGAPRNRPLRRAAP